MFFEKGYISIPECYRTYREIAQKNPPIWPEHDGPGSAAGSGMSGVGRSPENQALLDAYRRSERLRLNAVRSACLEELSRLIEYVRIVRPFGSPLAVAPQVLKEHTCHPASPAFFDLETGLVGYWRREPCPLEDLKIYDAKIFAAERILTAAPTILFCTGLEPVEGLDAWRGCFLAVDRDQWELAWGLVKTKKPDQDAVLNARRLRNKQHLDRFTNFWIDFKRPNRKSDWTTEDYDQFADHIIELVGEEPLLYQEDGLNKNWVIDYLSRNLDAAGTRFAPERAKDIWKVLSSRYLKLQDKGNRGKSDRSKPHF